MMRLSILILALSIVGIASAYNPDNRIFYSKGCMSKDFLYSCIFGIKKPAPERTNFKKDELILLYPSDSSINIRDITKKYNLKMKNKVVLSSVKTGMVVADTGGVNPLHLSKIINKKEKEVTSSTNNTFKVASASYKKGYPIDETGISTIHRTTRGKGVTICLIDTPVDIYHPTLSGSHIETLDLVKVDLNNSNAMLHGTSVAGILVSQNKFIGIAPKAKLYAISVFGNAGKAEHKIEGESSNVAKALDSCMQHDVDVINLSFTGGRDSLVEKLIKKAIEKGITVIAAGGNGGHWGSTIYPAVIPGVLAVTAVDANKELYKMADKGKFIDFAAPGVNVLTIAPKGKYKIVTGTSFAAAHLSGVAALLLSQNRNKKLEQYLSKTVIDLGKPGRDQEYGEGLINAQSALKLINKN